MSINNDYSYNNKFFFYTYIHTHTKASLRQNELDVFALTTLAGFRYNIVPKTDCTGSLAKHKVKIRR